MAGQKFTLTFDANLNVSLMKGALNQIQSTLNGLHLPQNIASGLLGTFNKLQKELLEFEVAVGKDITSKSDFNKLESQAIKLNDAFEKLKILVRDLAGLKGKDLEKLFPALVTTNISNASKALLTYKVNITNANDAVVDQLQEVDKLTKSIANLLNKKVYTGAEWKKLRDDIKATEQEIENYKDLRTQAELTAASVEAKTTHYKNSSIWRDALKDIKLYDAEIQRLSLDLTNLNQLKVTGITQEKQLKELNLLNTKLTEATTKLQLYKLDLALLGSTAAGGGLKKLIDDIGKLTGLDMSKFKQDTTGVADAINTYLNQLLQLLSSNLLTAEGAVNGADSAFNRNAQDVRDCADAYAQFNTLAREVDQLKSRIQYFFGLNNAIQLVKRTMREAYNTIKELDKAMTETAVVTDFSVGDMWAQLPDYTTRANELGVTTKAAYEAATLYYQQGLKTNEVVAMSNETLKMARIAGLDAAVATDRMTNAIRGFNMEINEMNALRIDDVYSRLAAISASNVDEISTAMTKVASLAHNANMEFETTAAFLAQIIETTRESAETAGTALKTVVARFSEVKKLVGEDKLQGNDEEGELIDVNKVSSALRTAGIDLNKYFLGEVGLDDIFMELASKWNSLTTLQLRYIATLAAGSRQQSRFIALMSDYARTLELVGEAYNANGAAAKLFEKTQESLESKLARLKNAWNEFAMGVLNSDLVKLGVDFLTNILNGINALTSGFGHLNEGIGGVINSVTKLAVAFAGLKIGQGLFGGLFGGLANGATGVLPGMAQGMGLNQSGKNIFATLGAGIAKPYGKLGSVIGKGGKAIWGGAKDLGAFLGFGTKGALMGGVPGSSLTGAAGITAGIGGLATALGAIVAIGGTVYVTLKRIYDLSPAGQVKIAEKYADSLRDISDSTQLAEKALRSVQDEYNALDLAVSNASTLEERDTAIKARTDYIKELIEQDATYMLYIQDFLTVGANGEIYLTLDAEKLELAVNAIADAAVKAKSAENIGNANLAYLQYQKTLNDIDLLQQQRDALAGSLTLYSIDHKDEIAELDQRIATLKFRAEEFTKQYQLFATQAATGVIDNTNLEEQEAAFLNQIFGIMFDGDYIAESLEDETKKFFGRINSLKGTGLITTLKEALQAYYDTFNTIFIPEDIKEDKQKLIDAVATERIRQNLEEGSQDLVNIYLGLNDEIRASLADLLLNKGKGLSLKQVDELTPKLPKILDLFTIEKDGEKISLLSLELINLLEDTINEASPDNAIDDALATAFKENIRTSLAGLVTKITDEFELGSTDAETITNLVKDIALQNYESASDFSDFLLRLLRATNPDDLESLLESLKVLDISDPNAINTFFKSLTGLDINFSDLGGSSEEAALELIKLANAVEQFNLDSIKEIITDNVSLMRDIKDRKDSKRTFTEEDYLLLTRAGVDPREFVYQGIKNKEWTYTGESLDLLVLIIADNLTKSISELMSGLLGYIQKGEQVQAINEQYITTGITDEKGNELNVVDAIAEILSNNQLLELTENSQWIKDLISEVFLQDASILLPELLLKYLEEALNWYSQLETNKEEYKTAELMAVNPINYVTDINDLGPMREDLYKQTIDSKFFMDEHAEDRYDLILQSIQLIDDANTQWNKSAEEQVTISRAIATNWSQQAAKLEELTEVLDKNDKILANSTNDADEYSGAIHKVGEAMRAAYGEQVTDEFVQAHIQQIVLARESKEAYQELLNLLQEDFFSNVAALSNEAAAALDYVRLLMDICAEAGMALDNLEINGVAVLDGTPWMDMINALIKAGVDVAAFFDTLGWTVTMRTGPDGIPRSVLLVRNQPTGYGGYQPYTGSNWGRGKSGGGGSKEKEPKKEEWKSDFDWLYNLLEDIEELQREQTELQDEQNKILEQRNTSDTGKDLYENLIKLMANLQAQRAYQTKVNQLRGREMQEFLAANSQYGGYFDFNEKDRTLEIDWDAINNIGDKDTYEKVKDLVSEAEKIQDKMDESEDAVRDIETLIRALEDIWRDTYTEFEKRVLEALVSSYQRVIDNYSSLHDTITDANNKILDAIQKEISLERQIRDNTDTERAITDNEARLAYLRRDTTGGNQNLILALEKELEDQRENYTDNLIDLAVNRLLEDNNIAAEQREHQIELMQAQLDYSLLNGEFNDLVYALISGAIGSNGELLTNSDLYDLLKQEESWQALGYTSREVWEDELNNTFKEVTAFLLKEQGEADGSYLLAVADEINDLGWVLAQVVAGATAEGFDAMSSALSIGLDSVGLSIGRLGAGIGSMSQAMEHVTYSFDDANGTALSAVDNLGNAVLALREANAEIANEKIAETISYSIRTLGSGYSVYAGDKPVITAHLCGSLLQVLYDLTNIKSDSSAYASMQKDIQADYLRKIKKFKTGGLNEQTGLAWLDGTPDEPEYVLNARLTDAFLKLAEVLPAMFNGNMTTTNNTFGGNVYIDLNMSIDSIANDYDVDSMVNRMKTDIVNAMNYRNVNAISFLR